MPQPMDSGDGLAEAASGVESSRTATEPRPIAGIWDSTGSEVICPSSSPSASP